MTAIRQNGIYAVTAYRQICIYAYMVGTILFLPDDSECLFVKNVWTRLERTFEESATIVAMTDPSEIDTLLAPWDQEPPLVSERDHTRWADPRWKAWNEHAVEFQVALFLQALARHVSGHAIVIETGTGQGFVTRRVADALKPDSDLFWVFESDPLWRSRLMEHPWFFERLGVCLKDDPTPTWQQMGAADLVILDSNDPYRTAELFLWYSVGKPGSVLFVHDTGNGHPFWDGHYTLGQVIRSAQMPGMWLENPRGSFISVRDSVEVPEHIKAIWRSVLEQTVYGG